MNRTITLLHAVMFCGCAGALHAQQPEATVIRGGTILTMSHGTIENGSIVIRDGKRMEIDQSKLVPGDLVYLEEGMKIERE